MAALYFTAGLGLFLGMMIARRVGAHMELMGSTVGFIGWTLVAQGILFAGIGLMPSLIWACLVLFVSRTLLGVEFAVQETLLMRLVPDHLRGRVSTTDRASELLVWSFSTAVAGLVATGHHAAHADGDFGFAVGHVRSGVAGVVYAQQSKTAASFRLGES